MTSSSLPKAKQELEKQELEKQDKTLSAVILNLRRVLELKADAYKHVEDHPSLDAEIELSKCRAE